MLRVTVEKKVLLLVLGLTSLYGTCSDPVGPSTTDAAPERATKTEVRVAMPPAAVQPAALR